MMARVWTILGLAILIQSQGRADTFPTALNSLGGQEFITSGVSLTYPNGGDGLFTANATGRYGVVTYLPAPSVNDSVYAVGTTSGLGSLQLAVNLNNGTASSSGQAGGYDLLIQGSVYPGGSTTGRLFSETLLTGNVAAYYSPGGTNPDYDFLFTITGGAMASQLGGDSGQVLVKVSDLGGTYKADVYSLLPEPSEWMAISFLAPLGAVLMMRNWRQRGRRSGLPT